MLTFSIFECGNPLNRIVQSLRLILPGSWSRLPILLSALSPLNSGLPICRLRHEILSYPEDFCMVFLLPPLKLKEPSKRVVADRGKHPVVLSRLRPRINGFISFRILRRIAVGTGLVIILRYSATRKCPTWLSMSTISINKTFSASKLWA